jgi:hypothetical protein
MPGDKERGKERGLLRVSFGVVKCSKLMVVMVAKL